MGFEAGEGFLGTARRLTCLTAEQAFGGGEERPTPTVFAVVLVEGIDEVFSDNTTLHLQAGDVAIEAAAHLGACEATGGSELAGDEAAMLAKGEEDGFLDAARSWDGRMTATPVTKVGPPLTTDETSLACEELTIDAMAFSDDGAFPFPQGPVPSAIG